MEAPVDVSEGFPQDVPLVFSYGHATPSENPELYRFIVDRLGTILNLRAEVASDAFGTYFSSNLTMVSSAVADSFDVTLSWEHLWAAPCRQAFSPELQCSCYILSSSISILPSSAWYNCLHIAAIT